MRDVVRRWDLDPIAFALALATGIAIFAVQQGPEWAVAGGLSVLAVALATRYALSRQPSQIQTQPVPASPPSPVAPPAADRPWYHPLTYRQSEIAALVAEALPSKVIADRLGIGERGVEATIQNIFNKLSEHEHRDFSSRLQIALWVKERQMAAAKTPETPATKRPVQP